MTVETSLRIAKQQLALVQERIDLLLVDENTYPASGGIRDAAKACIEIAVALSLAERAAFSPHFALRSEGSLEGGI